MRAFVCAAFMLLLQAIVALAQQQILVPTRPQGDNSNAAASTAFVQSAAVTVNAQVFGAVGDGVNDDAPAINQAISSCPAAGPCVVLVPGPNSKLGSTISIGDGTTSSGSTRTGVILRGVGIPSTTTAFGPYTQSTGPLLTWAGGTNTNVINVAGPLQGWGIENLKINCGSTVGLNGIRVQSAQYGDSKNLTFINCFQSIASQTVALFDSFTITDSFHNYYRNIHIIMPTISGSKGILITGDGVSTNANTDFNTFENLDVQIPITGGTTAYGIYLQEADGNQFQNVHLFGGNTGSAGVALDYNVNPGWPASNFFHSIDISTSNGLGSFVNIGTPSAGATPNYVFGLSETNGGVCPNVINLSAFCSHEIVLSPGGNNANSTAIYGSGHTTFNAPIVVQGSITGGANGGAQGQLILDGATSGNFTVSASATGSPQYGATTTNDNAPSGSIGEYVSATPGSPVSYTIGTPANVTSITLGAGDWDVSALHQIINFNGVSTSTLPFSFFGSVSPTSATLDTTETRRAVVLYPQIVSGQIPLANPGFMIGPARFSLSTTTTIFLVGEVTGGGTITFGSGTAIQGTGTIRARRVR
jgi:Pectate lyase superfamily protein